MSLLKPALSRPRESVSKKNVKKYFYFGAHVPLAKKVKNPKKK
jgi:hypothetical protein